MAMTWTSLTAAKGVTGSIANFVNYSKLDIETVLDEAQALLYGLLRVREMRTRYVFFMETGDTTHALPARFLDGIGRMYAPSLNMTFRHKDEAFVNEARIYQTLSGSLGADTVATTTDSSDLSVTIPSHGFNQGSIINLDGLDEVGGLDPNGTFEITEITDVNTIVVDASVLGTATSSAGGGGISGSYICNNIQRGSPLYWAVWDEKIQFDFAFVEAMSLTLQYYQSLPLLSATNASNFLTNRYPHLLRTACQASAADFMKDTEEYNKAMQRLSSLVQNVNSENDMAWRAMELETETP